MTMTAPQKFPLARRPIGPAPVRRPGSIRRTSTIDTSWPEGYGKPMLMQGVARDIWTPADGGAPVVLADDRYRIMASAAREILSITVSPDRPQAQQLIGVRGGGQSRSALTEIMTNERIKGSPLYLILDDFAGASLVSGWVWSRWVDDWMAMAEKSGLQSSAGRGGSMEGVCTGFSPGSSALVGEPGRRMKDQNCMTVPTLVNADDPDGWHALAEQEGVGMRRARRIDVWREDGELSIDVGFQDSGTQPKSTARIAIHEYHVLAKTRNGTLSELKVDPRILPFQECPGAVVHAQRMLGTSLTDMRAQVLATLPGILGCTHLNDVLRSLAEVPAMAAHLHP
jgi:Protein of unknown function (DUF2889)